MCWVQSAAGSPINESAEEQQIRIRYHNVMFTLGLSDNFFLID